MQRGYLINQRYPNISNGALNFLKCADVPRGIDMGNHGVEHEVQNLQRRGKYQYIATGFIACKSIYTFWLYIVSVELPSFMNSATISPACMEIAFLTLWVFIECICKTQV